VVVLGAVVLGRVLASGHPADLARAIPESSWAGSVFQSAALGKPGPVAVSDSGDILVLDTARGRVLRFSAAGHLIRVWGSVGSAPGQFLRPAALAIDPQGFVYIADTGNDRVQEFTLSGRYLNSIGSLRPGEPHLDRPDGVAIDSQGYVYISDRGHHRILLLSPSGRPAGSFRLSTAPGSIAVDPAGHAYILSGTRILVEYFAGRTSSTSPESPPVLQLPFTPGAVAEPPGGKVYVTDRRARTIVPLATNGQPEGVIHLAGQSAAESVQMGGLAVGTSGQFYVTRPRQRRIEVFSPAGALKARWGPSFTGSITDPEGVSVDAEGNLFISDTRSARVLELSATGNLLGSWGGPGSRQGQFRGPAGIAVSKDGSVYVADSNNNRVEALSPAGAIRTVAGAPPRHGALGDEPGRLDAPAGVAVGDAGRLFVADTFNGRVQVFGARGKEIAVWSHFGPLKTQHIFLPVSIATGPHHRVYVADAWLGRVAELTESGQLLRYWKTGEANGLGLSLAVDSQGTVYAANAASHRIQLYSSQGDLLGTLSDRAGHPLTFPDPTAITLGPGRTLYIADATLHRVLKFKLLS
jgi:DNA-binding beta-propeller fold protein YncE